jgi:CheY-like chemotaxis protein
MQSAALRSYRVLVIDDSEITLELECEALEQAGFEVRATSSVDRLDAVLADWTPELILTDVNMPGMNGDALCRRLKARYETAHVPIVLCSTLSRAELEELARSCEAEGFVSKSEGLDRLGEELRLICDAMSW